MDVEIERLRRGRIYEKEIWKGFRGTFIWCRGVFWRWCGSKWRRIYFLININIIKA
jgi:hypothetical protein